MVERKDRTWNLPFWKRRRLAPHGRVRDRDSELDIDQYFHPEMQLYQYLGILNVTGQPSVSLPLAWKGTCLPIGVQIAARIEDEAPLVAASRFFEILMPWEAKRPPVHPAEEAASAVEGRN